MTSFPFIKQIFLFNNMYLIFFKEQKERDEEIVYNITSL